MNFLLEIGMLATLGFGTDPQRLQDVQTPYFLLETRISEKYVFKGYVENRVYDWQTKEYLSQMEIGTKDEGFNYGVGVQSEYQMMDRVNKTGNVIYFKVSYRIGELK